MNVPRQPNQLFTTSIRLAAVSSAVPCSRMFVRDILDRWKLGDYIEVAELVVSELVTNAVKMTGITDPEPKTWDIRAEHVIGVQLRTTNGSLFVEVWDRIVDAPVAKNPDNNTEGGRGLMLICAMAKQWDVYRPQSGGKVVWAELELGKPAEPPPLSSPPLTVHVPGMTTAPRGATEKTAHLGLIERMLDDSRSEDAPPEA
ncbi:serine/threonine protein kinase [Streptomyces dysideae]|uniref:Serine/threonine protein kinase n=2 Tax=Streptomyces dysideae TaxID=909626 RepID=A0A124IEJ0_9ACTN|nr:serine/threonine protein kinase [Streptomyces dysideae]